jgi:hypothetical protein
LGIAPHALQPIALANEMLMVEVSAGGAQYVDSPAKSFAVAATAMRHHLVDQVPARADWGSSCRAELDGSSTVHAARTHLGSLRIKSIRRYTYCLGRFEGQYEWDPVKAEANRASTRLVSKPPRKCLTIRIFS